MKKSVAFILMLCMVLSFAACADNQTDITHDTTLADTTLDNTIPEDTTPEDTTPEITLQEVYEAGKSYAALLGDHESAHVQISSGGKLLREVYLTNRYHYTYDDAEYMDMGFDYSDFTTTNGQYVYFDGTYFLYVMITPDGMVATKDRFETVKNNDFISSAILDNNFVVTEKDGSIIVTTTSDMDDITLIGNHVISCEETYTLDATTREMTEVKTVYTYDDGTTEEGIATITRNVEAPEGTKPYLAYEEETENMRTVTLVSNPGAENEKIDSLQVPKGLSFGVSSHWEIAENYTLYSDAACTQPVAEDWDVNTDITIYIKWAE